MFLLAFVFLFSAQAQAINENGRDVITLKKNRAVFTLTQDIRLPSDKNADLWIQNGVVSDGSRLSRHAPACSLRHYGRGETLRRGTSYNMPDAVMYRVTSFRTIPLERRTGMTIDCASRIDYGRFGAYLDGNQSDMGALSIGQLRQALGGTMNLRIIPRDTTKWWTVFE